MGGIASVPAELAALANAQRDARFLEQIADKLEPEAAWDERFFERFTERAAGFVISGWTIKGASMSSDFCTFVPATSTVTTAYEKMQADGATYIRMTEITEPDGVWLEGWRTRPAILPPFDLSRRNDAAFQAACRIAEALDDAVQSAPSSPMTT